MISIFSKKQNRDLLYRGCECQVPNARPPCHFCTSLTEKECDIWLNHGLRGLRDYINYRDIKNERRIELKNERKLEVNKEEKPWIGIDFDGTLSYSKDKKVPNLTPTKLLPHVKKLVSLGAKIKILTAREDENQKQEIVEFLKRNDLPQFEITNKKDKYMVLLIDDRALSVIRNTGEYQHEILFEIRTELIKRGLDKSAPFDTIIEKINIVADNLIKNVYTLAKETFNGNSKN
jgi:hypothetical protein